MGVSTGEIKDSIKEGHRLSIEETVSEDINNLITKSWDQNPRLRPSFKDISKLLASYHSALVDLDQEMPLNENPIDSKRPIAFAETSTQYQYRKPTRSRENIWKRFQTRKKLAILSCLTFTTLIVAATVTIYVVQFSKSAVSETATVTISTIISETLRIEKLSTETQILSTLNTRTQSSLSVMPTTTSTPQLTVSTYAGSGNNGVVDASRLFASFGGPYAIVIDKNDNIFVSDHAHIIRKIDIAGEITTVAGIPYNPGLSNGLAPASMFRVPTGMCIRTDGSLIVADSFNNAIRSISPDLKNVTTIAGNGTVGKADNYLGSLATFSEPFGVACDNKGNVYVSESANNLVKTN